MKILDRAKQALHQLDAPIAKVIDVARAVAPKIALAAHDAKDLFGHPVPGGKMAPTPPPGVSPLMGAVYAAVQPRAGDGTVPGQLVFSTANTVDPQIQIQGPRIFAAQTKAIAGAKAEVLLETYVWEQGSEPTRILLDGIRQLEANTRASGGGPVTVKMLVDEGPGNHPGMRAAMQADIDALHLDPRLVTVECASKQRLGLGALHAKTVTVDRHTTLLTGANPQAHHSSGQPWFDLGYRIDGAAAKATAADFAWNWHAATGREVPPIATQPEPLIAGTTPILVATRQADGRIFSDGPGNPQGRAFLALLGNATKEIRMQTPNLNDPQIEAALIAAAKRGVKVELVLSKGFNDDSESKFKRGGTNVENAAKLYQAVQGSGGAPNLSIKWFSPDGQAPLVGNGPEASHAKLMVVDGQVAVVGSANGDKQSGDHSQEVNAFIDSPRFAQQIDAQVWGQVWRNGIPADLP